MNKVIYEVNGKDYTSYSEALIEKEKTGAIMTRKYIPIKENSVGVGYGEKYKEAAKNGKVKKEYRIGKGDKF